MKWSMEQNIIRSDKSLTINKTEKKFKKKSYVNRNKQIFSWIKFKDKNKFLKNIFRISVNLLVKLTLNKKKKILTYYNFKHNRNVK